MINISKLLKDAPKDMKLYSPLFGEVKFKYINDSQFGIIVEDSVGCSRSFDKYGRYFTIYNNAECLLFPSKECRTWEGWTPCVEPKFKVGDWIVGNEGIFKITQYEEEYGYYLTDTTGRVAHFVSPDYVESNFHLWTIDDAKDGDILTASDKSIFIYAGFTGVLAQSYIALLANGDLNTRKCNWEEKTSVAPATKEQCDLLFAKMKEAGYQWDSEKKELRNIVEPKFKVGDWIAYNENKSSITPTQIIKITENKYIVSGHWAYDFRTLEADWHLWTIQDAKDGDVLACSDWLFILKQFNVKENKHKTYCHYDLTLNHFKDDTDSYMISGSDEFHPANNEERGLLFAKMREAGYEWDADKKELRKIRPHYDISNFKPFDKVLCRGHNRQAWRPSLYGFYDTTGKYPMFVCATANYLQCIPFEGNEHLLGTTDMCDEMYVNWRKL